MEDDWDDLASHRGIGAELRDESLHGKIFYSLSKTQVLFERGAGTTIISGHMLPSDTGRRRPKPSCTPRPICPPRPKGFGQIAAYTMTAAF